MSKIWPQGKKKEKRGHSKVRADPKYKSKEEEVEQGATVANVTDGARRAAGTKKQDEQLRTVEQLRAEGVPDARKGQEKRGKEEKSHRHAAEVDDGACGRGAASEYGGSSACSGPCGGMLRA